MANAFVPGAARLDARQTALVGRRAAALGTAYRLFYDEPVEFVRGEGVWLFDPDGRRYLDAYNNVASLGHAHPAVVEAIARQAATLSTHTRYLDEATIAFAERLLSLFPSALDRVTFTCTGSEANDLALRMARAVTGRRGLVVTAHAYHGVTAATAACSPSLGPGRERSAEVYTVPVSRGGTTTDAEEFRAGVLAAVAAMRADGIEPAALLADTILSSDGVVPHPVGLLSLAAETIRSVGGLFIADEVQAGFARTGDRFWGFERHDVVPDLVTMGKPMGNGYPVAAVVARASIADAFGARTRYFNTFGGNGVAIAAASAVLDAIEQESLAERARTQGGLLAKEICALAARSDAIRAVRQCGLYLGVDMRDAASAASVVNGMRRRSVLISCTGPEADVLKIRPPLVFTQEHGTMLVDALSEAVRDL